mgnify:CR=1 FL=1
MIELIKGLALSGVAFVVIIALCAAIGKTAEFFSPYKNKQ